MEDVINEEDSCARKLFWFQKSFESWDKMVIGETFQQMLGKNIKHIVLRQSFGRRGNPVTFIPCPRMELLSGTECNAGVERA